MKAKSLNNDFKVYLPISDLYKAKDQEGNDIMQFEGLASTNSKDADGEWLDYNGFDLEEFAFVNWNHEKGPDAIIGEPVSYEIKPGKGLFVKGMLYPEMKKARDTWDLMQALRKSKRGNKLGISVEGKVLERDDSNPKVIKKARIKAIALCPFPKNGDTWADLISKGFTSNKEPLIDTDNEDFIYDFIDDNRRITVDKKGTIVIKSIDTESFDPATQESVEGDPKRKKSKNKDNHEDEMKEKEVKLTKSQVYYKIFSYFGDQNQILDIDSAKRIYDYIEKAELIQNPNMEQVSISEETIKKALDNLMPQEEEVEEVKKVEKAEGVEKESKKAEMPPQGNENEEEEGEEEEVKKAKAELEKAQKAYDDAMRSKAKKEQPEEEEVEKSEPFDLTPVMNKLEELTKGFDGKFQSVGELFLAQRQKLETETERNEELQKSVTELKDLIEQVTGRVKEIENQPVEKKSFTTKPVERFEKSHANGERVFSVSDKLQKAQVLETLEGMAIGEVNGERQIIDARADLALRELGTSGSVNQGSYDYLLSKGIRLVK